MKNLIFVFLFISSLSYSQEIYTFKSGGRVFENSLKINARQIETYFDHKPEIMKLYKAGKRKKTIGNIFLYGGIATIALKYYKEISDNAIDNNGRIINQTTNTMYFVGAGIALISIPIKIGYSNKIRKAVTLMNEEVTAQKQNTGFHLETNIIANTDGVGLKLTF